jgi:multimeric flavodoxin WrbA
MSQLNILAIIGSYRNEESYSYKTLKLIEERMNARQPTRFEYIFLQRVGLPFCDGCLSCVRKGEEYCPEFESIAPIVKKMELADGIALAAPVYTFNVTGLMKNFCEYFMYKRNRPSFFGKQAIVVTAASGGGHKVVLDFLQRTAGAWGCDVVGRLGISASQMKSEAYIQKVDAAAQDVAEKFSNAIINQDQQSPDFGTLINFRAMQLMTNSATTTKNYRYWAERGWLDADYYTNVPSKPLTRLAVNYITWRIRAARKKGKISPVR